MADVKTNSKRLHELESWMRSYKPEELFDSNGTLIAELRELAPAGDRRMGSTPHANGGHLKKALHLPDFRDYALKVEMPGVTEAENTRPLGAFLRDVMKLNMKNFRVFGPDENTSNKLDDIYKVSKKLWLEEYFPEDADGGELASDGRVLEMLSENTVEGMLEGYLLTGRHGFISSYEAFIHVIDSMFNQHAKWLTICNHLPWRDKIASLNILVTSTVWRQDHNGFTHQDPGFLDVALNKSSAVVRIYLPPDVNTLLSVADHCLRSENYVNVIVCDKQKHLQYLSMDQAIIHCTKGIGRWEAACSDQGVEPDLVMASAGDIPTQETLAAITMLREAFPDLKIRYINVVDLLRLQPQTEHPHGLSDQLFDLLFTVDKPVIFNFHGYPWLIHRLAYSRTNHANFHVHGYREEGNINTPLELAIENGIDRFTLAMDAIKYVPRLQRMGSAALAKFHNEQISCRNYAFAHGTDKPEVADWRWPHEKTRKAA
jgi:xylulose-5-phosphate/fructose-6-phosphate phosphoketolase